jgi:hypothetical protein
MDVPKDDRSASLSADSTDSSAIDRRDMEIINRNADRLNREALDTLEYQQLPEVGRRAKRPLADARGSV